MNNSKSRARWDEAPEGAVIYTEDWMGSEWWLGHDIKLVTKDKDYPYYSSTGSDHVEIENVEFPGPYIEYRPTEGDPNEQ